MAKACGCRRVLAVARERHAEGFGAFGGGQTAALNALKNRWLRHVAAALNALKNRWLGHVAARVVASCVGLQSSDAKQPRKEPRSTPPVVPGAAPASAKAGVGGYQI